MNKIETSKQIQLGFQTEESIEAYTASLGKTIASLNLESDDALHFKFLEGGSLKVFDDGQDCCESRYMRTDDHLADFLGAKLLGVVIKDAPDRTDSYDVHEVQFLEFATDRGVFTMSSHNEHNGYYGGFGVRFAEDKA